MIRSKLLLFGMIVFGLVYNECATADVTVPFSIENNGIAESLTGKSGDPKAGRAAAINRKKGNCLACHTMPIPEQPFHGEIGPDLSNIGSQLTEAELRLLVVNAKLVREGTIMPAFYWSTGYQRILKKFKGKTILSAEQVEDIVAYLVTLK